MEAAESEKKSPVAVEKASGETDLPVEHWLVTARDMVPVAIGKAKEAVGFTVKWRVIVSRLGRFPSCISDLSTHPFFSKNLLCKEQLQSMCLTLSEVVLLAEGRRKNAGKLQMQSDLDAVLGMLDLNIRDCRLLVKTGVLGEPLPTSVGEKGRLKNISELLARLQIGDQDAKIRAVDDILEKMNEDDDEATEKSVSTAILSRRSNVAAIIRLLTTSAYPNSLREKLVSIISLLLESRSSRCENLLISEGVLPPLLRSIDSGGSTLVAKEKALFILQKLSSTSVDAAVVIVKKGGVGSLLELCSSSSSCSSSSQVAAARILKNISGVSDLRQSLVDEGIIRVMLNLLEDQLDNDDDDEAAQCIHNLTTGTENLRQSILTEGGFRCLLTYLNRQSSSPSEAAISALRNLIPSFPEHNKLLSLLLPTVSHVLNSGSAEAQQSAASVLCLITTRSMTVKKWVGEYEEIIPVLIGMLESKTSGRAREAAAQGLYSLMSCRENRKMVKKDTRSVPNLVQLLDLNPNNNTARKYAVACLLEVSGSRRCRRSMVSYGAIGYLKKLVDMEVIGAVELLERLEWGMFKGFRGSVNPMGVASIGPI